MPSSAQNPFQKPPLAGPRSSSESTATLRQTTPSSMLGRSRGLSVSTVRATSKLGGAQAATSTHRALAQSFPRPRQAKLRSYASPAAVNSPITVLNAHPGPPDHPGSPVPTSWWGRNVRHETLHAREQSPPNKLTRATAAIAYVLGASLLVTHETLLLTSEFLDISIQIRILKQVQAAELRRQSTHAFLHSVICSQQQLASVPSTALQGLGITLPKDTSGLPPSSSHKSLAP
ncbi:hypothetical protein GGX14DRAFT_569789 [Mycena pura]|uniref:Uncharacterized protein n=1 Tax=Mycena pura TaxID=153505 RepID=A0AAD6Y6A4_9AGAR|nr:hypothetical protein GGX14DRAFT_701749 [Mycena pura]KAJ7203740.1 hypothetical protein GGX14DRAFT_569789 [Mycena pura]